MRFTKLVHWIKLFANSASFSLLLSIILFSFEMFGSMEESKEMTENLLKIQNSLSTKYLGKFPSFLPDINRLYAEVAKDEEIVMEQTYKNYPSITLVHIDDFLSIRGWLITRRKGESRAIMAFPSRYSSSEIGFYTTDESTIDYIKTMQQGILVNYADGL